MRFLDLDGCPYEDFGNSKCQGHGNQKQVVKEQDKSMSDLVKVKMVELQD